MSWLFFSFLFLFFLPMFSQLRRVTQKMEEEKKQKQNTSLRGKRIERFIPLQKFLVSTDAFIEALFSSCDSSDPRLQSLRDRYLKTRCDLLDTY